MHLLIIYVEEVQASRWTVRGAEREGERRWAGGTGQVGWQGRGRMRRGLGVSEVPGVSLGGVFFVVGSH